MTAVGYGIALGVMNVLVIAFGIAFMNEPESRDAGWVVTFGLGPALLAGALLGCIAHGFRSASRRARVPLLVLPSLGVVYALASKFYMLKFAPFASIPTIAFALVLECWTRVPEAPPAVPVARVR